MRTNAVEAGGPVEAFVERDDSGIRIRCTDLGPGIQATHAQRVGEPFFSTKAQGTGLGLTLVKAIAAEHGGDFELRNRPEQGAEAQLCFPNGSTAVLRAQAVA